MANDYFNHSANVIASGIRALAAQVNNIATEISTGLDLLPTEIQLKRGLTRFAVDTGAADAYVVALPYTPALVDGLEVSFRPINSSTGASTIDVNGLGAKSLVLFDLTALGALSIVANSMVMVRYSAPGDHFVLMTGAASVQSVNDANSLDGLDSTQFKRTDLGEFVGYTDNGIWLNLQMTDPAGRGLQIVDNTGNVAPGGRLIYAVANQDNRTTDLVGIAQQGDLSTATALRIDQEGTGAGIFVDLSSSGIGLDVRDNSTSAGGQLAFLYSDNASRTAELAYIHQDNASSIARALIIQQDGNSDGVQVIQNHAQGKGLVLTSGVASRNVALAELGVTNSTGAGVVLAINQSQQGDAITVNCKAVGNGVNAIDGSSGVGGTLIRAYSDNASRNAVLMKIIQDNVAASAFSTCLTTQQDGPADSIVVTNNGIGNGILSSANNSASTAIRAYSNMASRTAPLVEIINDNATGSGVALHIQQDQAGYALDLDQNANSDGIRINSASTANSMYYGFSSSMTNGQGLWLSLANSSFSGFGIRCDLSGSSATGDGVVCNHSGTGNAIRGSANNPAATAGRFYSNEATRTQPLVEIVNDNSTGSGVSLTIQSDQGKALDITGGGINENAEQYSVTVGTKSIDLNRGTAFYPSGAMTAVAVDFTFDNPAPSGQHCSFILELSNMTVNTDVTPWPASVDWAGGTEPAWTAGIDIVSFWTRDGGTTWHGMASSLDSQ